MPAKHPREEGRSCPAPLPSPEGSLRTPHPPQTHTLYVPSLAGVGTHWISLLPEMQMLILLSLLTELTSRPVPLSSSSVSRWLPVPFLTHSYSLCGCTHLNPWVL